MSQPLRVLIVEDSQDDAELLLIKLEEGDYSPISFQRVETTAQMNIALEHPEDWDLIIADHHLPAGFSSVNALSILQEKNLDIPFIIVSGTIDEDIAVTAMKAGAQDYVYKGNLARLIPAIERELKEAQVRQEHRQTIKKLDYLNLYDTLTGLPNRNFFLSCLRECIENQQKTEGLFAVLFLNVDRFQMVKYSFGHHLGNQLLIATAERLKECIQSPNVLARMREDEFIILLPKIKDNQEVLNLAQHIHQLFSIPFDLDNRIVYSTSSIGIVLGNIGCQNPEEFLRAADIAKHHAQKKSTPTSVIYDASMQKRAAERLQLETDLQEAIQNQELSLHYQPIVSLSTGELTGFEALVRWEHPTRGMISPVDFIPLAEETGLIIPLGQWALTEACRRLRVWQEQFPHLPSLSVSVNLSGVQLSSPDLIRHIDELLDSVGLTGDSLKLEITESFLMENLLENPTAANQILAQLKDRNIKLCIDDFGTGYSSLSYLHYLPIDILKIDRSFLNPKGDSHKNNDIVKSIIKLAKDLGLRLVAEGIETEKQLTMLQELQCDYGQGYFFARPLDVHKASQLMRQKYGLLGG